jgi:hypothetical protein
MKALQAGLVVAIVAGSIAVAATTTTTGCTAASQVRQIFTALDGAGNRPRNIFYTDTSTIYCDIVFSANSNDETVDVTFLQTTGEQTLYEGSDNKVPVSRLWLVSEATPTEGIATIGVPMSPPVLVDGGTQMPFPVGIYECDVQVNGEDAGKAQFEIKYPSPDCPASGGAYDGLPCIGNKVGDQCPVDSNYQQNGTSCNCPATAVPTDRVWVCQ